jgi:hypothetical protein
VGRLEIVQDLLDRHASSRAGLLERMLAAAAGLEAVRHQGGTEMGIAGEKDLDRKLRIKQSLRFHEGEDEPPGHPFP